MTALRRVAVGSQGKWSPRSVWRVEFRPLLAVAGRVVMNRNLFLAAGRALGMNVKAVRDAACESLFSPLTDRTMVRPLRMDKSARRRESKTTDLYAELSRALEAGRLSEALDLYELIEKRRPDEPRWSHRKGDLLRRMGRKADAVLAYERAVDLYAAKGFDARAAATAKIMLAIDRSKSDVLERVSRPPSPPSSNR